MIDIKYLREKPEEVKARIKKREMDLDSIVDEVLSVDAPLPADLPLHRAH